MSSRPEVLKPDIKKPPRGIQPKRSQVVKLASPDVVAAVKNPLPSGQLDAADQSFAGIPSPPIDKKQEKIFIKSRANPLINPLISPLRPVQADSGPSLPAAPIAIKKPLKHAKKTPDYVKREQKLDPETQEKIDTQLAPIFKEYQDTQTAIESNNPYLTDTVLYTPQSRKSFYRFISDTYTESFKLPLQVKGRIDEEACAKLGAAAGVTVEAFLYQKFIREYIRNASPYRGILVYHGLGSGKTCSAIAAAEALYGTSNKKIIVMTPFSLRGNFMSEISFCGFRHFNTQNHWVSESLVSEGGIAYMYARSVLSLSESYLRKVLDREEEDRKTLWIPDFTKDPNYDTLSQQDRDDIRAQITNMIENRVKFISYNGVTAKELKKYACNTDPVTGERFFDNAVIVIDEIHNLTRLMQGEITPYITKRKGRPRKIPVEPIVPGKWVPGLCTSDLIYKRSYLFYKLLTDARNSKIIGLSGTPLINFPDELGVLANVLSGYIECVEVILNSADKSIIDKFRKIAEAESRVDIVRFTARAEKVEVLISVFNEGYEKSVDDIKDGDEDNSEFVGIKYNPDAQEGIRTVYERIKAKLLLEKIPIGLEQFVSYPRLPVDDKEFKEEFIDPVNLSVKNKVVLQKRLTGLISYYKGSKEEYMPRVLKDEVVRCEMSDYVLSMYTLERNREIKGEKGKVGEKGDDYAAVEQFAKMKNPSSYRFRSRALCNFAFPDGIERPFPGTLEEEEEEVVQPEDIDMGEAATEVEEDLAAQELVAEEEKSIIDPEEEGEEGEEEEEGEGEKEESEDLERVEESVLEGAVETKAAEEGVAVMKGGAGPEPVKRTRPKVAVSVSPAPPVPSVPAPQPSAVDTVLDAIAEAPKSIADAIGSVAAEPAAVVAAELVTEDPIIAAAEPVVAEILKSEVAKPEPRVIRRRPQVAMAAPTPVVIAAPVELQEGTVSRVLSYQERIKRAMDKLDTNRDNYLKLDSSVAEGRLAQYSTKLDQMIRRIMVSRGSNLVYSQFKTVEGLGVLRLALKANGFVEIEVEGGNLQSKAVADNKIRFTKETEDSLRKGPEAQEKRFVFLTGEGIREKRNLVLNIFNGNFDKIPEDMRRVLEESGYGERKNTRGEICWVFGITGAGAEGISLKCCRSVHIMEPYWNKVRLDQVKGRAIRICSHQDLPFNQRDVEIYTYYTIFSADQKNMNKIDVTIRQTDEDETSDEKVYNVGLKKDKINQELLDLMKETSVDCGLNAGDNGAVSCFVVDGKPDQYLFDPNLQVDKILTSIEIKEIKEVKGDLVAPEASALKQLGEKAPIKADIEQITVIKYKGVEYLLRPKKGSGGLVFELFGMADDTFKKALGEMAINPGTGTFKGSKPTFKV